MTQIHAVIRRVNPALKIDLVQVGCLKDGRFEPLPFDAIKDTPIARFLKSSHISDSLYIDHSEVFDLVTSCGDLPGSIVDFFDNTIVLIFNFGLNYYESTTKEEGTRN